MNLAPPPPASAAAPRFARPFVTVFLTAVVVCGAVGVNASPFSNWRLFSHLAHDKQTSWQAFAVDSTGLEQSYPISAPPHGYHGLGFVMNRFARMSTAARDRVCDQWMRGATAKFGPTTESLRIYRLDWLVSVRQGDRPAPPHRSAVWTCTVNGARELG